MAETIMLPVKLNDSYTCQGRDANGNYVVFDDLLREGERVATRRVGDDLYGPHGVVTRHGDGLWIEAESDA